MDNGVTCVVAYISVLSLYKQSYIKLNVVAKFTECLLLSVFLSVHCSHKIMIYAIPRLLIWFNSWTFLSNGKYYIYSEHFLYTAP